MVSQDSPQDSYIRLQDDYHDIVLEQPTITLVRAFSQDKVQDYCHTIIRAVY